MKKSYALAGMLAFAPLANGSGSVSVMDPPQEVEYLAGQPLGVSTYFSDTNHRFSLTLRGSDGEIYLAGFENHFVKNLNDDQVFSRDKSGKLMSDLAAVIQSEINDGDEEFVHVTGFGRNSSNFRIQSIEANGYEVRGVGGVRNVFTKGAEVKRTYPDPWINLDYGESSVLKEGSRMNNSVNGCMWTSGDGLSGHDFYMP